MRTMIPLLAILAGPVMASPEVVRFDPSTPFDPAVDSLRLTDFDPMAPDIEISFFADDPGGGSNAEVWHPQVIGFGWDPFGGDGLVIETSIIIGEYLEAGMVVPDATPGPWGVAERDVFYGASPDNYALQRVAYEVFPFQDDCLSCSYVEFFLSIEEGVHYIAMRWDEDGQTRYGWLAFEVEYLEYPNSCIFDDGLSCDGRDLESLRLLGLRYLAVGWETEPDTSIVVGGGLCRVDMNFDTVIDFFDVSQFISLFASGDSAADYTGDGNIDFFDISAFISEFNAGCDF